MDDNIILNPEYLVFEYCTAEPNLPKTFELTNNAGSNLAWKVKMTAPKRYKVSPKRGILRPQEKIQVSVQILYAKLPPNEKNDRNNGVFVDKYQFESVIVSSSIPLDAMKDTKWATNTFKSNHLDVKIHKTKGFFSLHGISKDDIAALSESLFSPRAGHDLTSSSLMQSVIDEPEDRSQGHPPNSHVPMFPSLTFSNGANPYPSPFPAPVNLSYDQSPLFPATQPKPTPSNATAEASPSKPEQSSPSVITKSFTYTSSDPTKQPQQSPQASSQSQPQPQSPRQAHPTPSPVIEEKKPEPLLPELSFKSQAPLAEPVPMETLKKPTPTSPEPLPPISVPESTSKRVQEIFQSSAGSNLFHSPSKDQITVPKPQPTVQPSPQEQSPSTPVQSQPTPSPVIPKVEPTPPEAVQPIPVTSKPTAELSKPVIEESKVIEQPQPSPPQPERTGSGSRITNPDSPSIKQPALASSESSKPQSPSLASPSTTSTSPSQPSKSTSSSVPESTVVRRSSHSNSNAPISKKPSSVERTDYKPSANVQQLATPMQTLQAMAGQLLLMFVVVLFGFAFSYFSRPLKY